MKRRLIFFGTCILGASVTACSAVATGDPARGEKLHQECVGCHGTELYVPPKAKLKALSALKKEVEAWNDHMNPKFTAQEVADLVAYLNRDFYKFPE